ncbi:MAG TPA: hypothetical protein VHX52_14315 [Steroidobacteraceae bacterium]|jgi:hypothetical protein|nr:hypothetical protein [Steroidobacteraceae bacterium]
MALRQFFPTRLRQRIALAMAVAILFAGIAQAAHYHKDELVHPGSTDVHCLLCLYAAGTAGPPAIASLVPDGGPRQRDYRPPHSIPCPFGIRVASYDARGPPLA